MSNTEKSISDHRVFVHALERVEMGEMTTNVLRDAPVDSYGLCREIVFGVQRWKGSLDKMIQTNVKASRKLGATIIVYGLMSCTFQKQVMLSSMKPSIV